MSNLFLYKTLIKPISTEKSVYSAEKNRNFVFKVSMDSNKKKLNMLLKNFLMLLLLMLEL